ncbi:MAG TPA: Uma2 family endonuclease [Gemmata sp.]
MTPTVSPELDLKRIKVLYEIAERRFLKSLPLEHFMESTPQATQRAITLASFALVQVSRPDVQCFNELLVQYPRAGQDADRPGQVVPDNMVVIHPRPIVAEGSYMTPLQPVGPFLVLEYVSKASAHKDEETSYTKYEKELRVPYYLLFYPDGDEFTLFRLGEKGYTSVVPNALGRCPIPELELEVGQLGRWVRYWFRGELLPLPGDLLKERDEARRQLDAERQARQAAEAELAKLREELARAKSQSE